MHSKRGPLRRLAVSLDLVRAARWSTAGARPSSQLSALKVAAGERIRGLAVGRSRRRSPAADSRDSHLGRVSSAFLASASFCAAACCSQVLALAGSAGEPGAALGEQQPELALRFGPPGERRALVPVGGASAVGREAALGGRRQRIVEGGELELGRRVAGFGGVAPHQEGADGISPACSNSRPLASIASGVGAGLVARYSADRLADRFLGGSPGSGEAERQAPAGRARVLRLSLK